MPSAAGPEAEPSRASAHSRDLGSAARRVTAQIPPPDSGSQALPPPHLHPGRTWSGQPQAPATPCAPGACGWRVDLALRCPTRLSPVGAGALGRFASLLPSTVGSAGCPEWTELRDVHFDREQGLVCAACDRSLRLTLSFGTYTRSWLGVRAVFVVNNTGPLLSPRLE